MSANRLQAIFTTASAVDKAISKGDFFKNQILLDGIKYSREQNSKIHIITLLSKSETLVKFTHVQALLRFLSEHHLPRVAIHAVTDGLDSPPTSAQIYLDKLHTICQNLQTGTLSNLLGRYYLLDDEEPWAKNRQVYHHLVSIPEPKLADYHAVIHQAYQHGNTDRYLPLTWLTPANGHEALILQKGDVVIFPHYSGEGLQTIIQMLLHPKKFELFHELEDLLVLTMTNYEEK